MTEAKPPRFQPDAREAERLQKVAWGAVAFGVLGVLQVGPIIFPVFAIVLGLSARGRDVDRAHPTLQARARLAISLGVIGLLVTLVIVIVLAVVRTSG
jgi:hypothetical protein